MQDLGLVRIAEEIQCLGLVIRQWRNKLRSLQLCLVRLYTTKKGLTLRLGFQGHA